MTGFISAGAFNDIPDSAVLLTTGDDYDGAGWQSQIGPTVSDVSGGATKSTATYRSQSITVVQYDSGGDYSQTTNLNLTNSKQAVLMVAAQNQTSSGGNLLFFDGGDATEYAFSDSNPYRFRSGTIDDFGGTVDQKLNIFAVEADGASYTIYKNDLSSPIFSGSTDPAEIDGLTINNRADGAATSDTLHDYAAFEVLDGHTQTQLNNEFDRLKTKYNIP